MMKERDEMVTLSIYIATYNRKNILKAKVKEILSVMSEDFNIWILDDCSDDGTYEMLLTIRDKRLNVVRNSERVGIKKDGAMPNWYVLLEKCDGKFALHLNDRDVFYADKLLGLIRFLKLHPDYTGGICDSFSGIKYYDEPEKALMQIPYCASHPTGIVFNMDLYRSICNRAEFFKKEVSYIHPHDLILGKLSEYGKMFRYDKIYEFANTESFAKNKSFYYNKGDSKTSWFSPEERLKEFEMFIRHLKQTNFCECIKKRKSFKISRVYLYYCTYNYKYYVTDLGQTQHYGIQPQKFGNKQLIENAILFANKSSLILRKMKIINGTFFYKAKIGLYFIAIFVLKPIWDLYKKGVGRKW